MAYIYAELIATKIKVLITRNIFFFRKLNTMKSVGDSCSFIYFFLSCSKKFDTQNVKKRHSVSNTHIKYSRKTVPLGLGKLICIHVAEKRALWMESIDTKLLSLIQNDCLSLFFSIFFISFCCFHFVEMETQVGAATFGQVCASLQVSTMEYFE